MDAKEKRNLEIIKHHNDGLTIREIAMASGLGKSAIHKIISNHLSNATQELAKQIKPSKDEKVILSGSEQRISSFIGFTRIERNVYADNKTGEVMRVAFVPASNRAECGYFAQL